MANAVIARWHGDNYQARIFWENAFNLLDKTSGVVEVAFEGDGPKAFDDVVVKYDPPVVRSGPYRVPAEYHQVKWHVAVDGRFGYEDLVVPDFIGATKSSLLERLRDAHAIAQKGSKFSFITTYRIKDGDPLATLISGHDKSILIERLFDSTGDRSKMGKVRKLWREHLGLSDEELMPIISGLRIIEGHATLEDLRKRLRIQARSLGLDMGNDTESDFRYDELARQLKIRGINKLTEELFRTLCAEEGLLIAHDTSSLSPAKVAIRSFLGIAASIVGAPPENTLILTDDFRNRYIQIDKDWQADIRPKVSAFLTDMAKKYNDMQLILDAHASIAFLAGAILDLKSGIRVELMQKGQVGSEVWHASDATADGAPPLTATIQNLGSGNHYALAVNLTHKVDTQVKQYIEANSLDVGTWMVFDAPNGPGQQSVRGGQHAARLAEQISNAVREIKSSKPDSIVHIFAACPNSFLFYLGQQWRGIAPCIIYEFDFDRRETKTYQPSFIFE